MVWFGLVSFRFGSFVSEGDAVLALEFVSDAKELSLGAKQIGAGCVSIAMANAKERGWQHCFFSDVTD